MTPLYDTPRPAVAQAQMECHAEGHQWRPLGLLDPSQAEPGLRAPWGGNGTLGRQAQCVSCGGRRVRWYTASGDVVNRYKYQDGYLHQRGPDDEPAPTRGEWRQRLVKTLWESLEAQAHPEPAPTRKARKASAS